MPDIPLPEDLSTYIRSMESRIRALETAPRAQDTSLPWSYSIVDPNEFTVSTTATDLATYGPEITTTVGQTGRVFINAGAYMNPVYGAVGYVYLYIDGAYYRDILAFGSDPTSQIIGSVATTRVVTGLSAGSHTFTLKYLTNGFAAVNFAARFLTVQAF